MLPAFQNIYSFDLPLPSTQHAGYAPIRLISLLGPFPPSMCMHKKEPGYKPTWSSNSGMAAIHRLEDTGNVSNTFTTLSCSHAQSCSPMLSMHNHAVPCSQCTIMQSHALNAQSCSPMLSMHNHAVPCSQCTIMQSHALNAQSCSPMLSMHNHAVPCSQCTIMQSHALNAQSCSPMLSMHNHAVPCSQHDCALGGWEVGDCLIVHGSMGGNW